MVLDIGAKSSNVLFFEDGKIFSRSINIGANAITQEFATEQKMRFPEAEQFKLEQGFVALGGLTKILIILSKRPFPKLPVRS